jgi:putative ABC transport system substrate-binding protein
MRRREFITFLSGAVATWPLAAYSQLATKMPQIGVLSVGRGDKSDASLTTVNAFISALRELGYTEGLNIAFERKFADGDANKLSGLAQELVDRRVDAIVALATPAARAAKQATSAIPIVAIGMADPVGDELVSSLARPGGNVTGTTFLGPELVSKRLQLLKEIVPGLSRVVVLWHPRAYGERTMSGMLKEIESTAQSLGTKLQLVPAASPDDLSSAFAAMTTERADGLIQFPSPMLFSQYYGVNLPNLSGAPPFI